MNEIGVEVIDGSIKLSKGFGDEKKVFVTKERENKNQMGGAYEKRKLDAVVDRKDRKRKERTLGLVLKKIWLDYHDDFPFEKQNASMSEKYIGKWRLLKEVGIPTVPSMRLVDEETVAMGDMTRDGSQFFGKAKYIEALEGGDLTKRPISKIEKLFLDINPRNIKREIARVQKLAWEKGIILPLDDPYDLIVHPDGTWQVLVLDLSWLRPRRKTDRVEDLEIEKKIMWEDIDIIRKYLLTKKFDNERQ